MLYLPPYGADQGEEKKKMKTTEQAGPNNNWHYNKKLQPFANQLRKTMTKSEVCLWKYALKSGKLSNWQFRRQRPVLNYITDFMCKELLLVIELDGITHLWDETIAKDKKKKRPGTSGVQSFKVSR